jgi:hypothetical protein
VRCRQQFGRLRIDVPRAAARRTQVLLSVLIVAASAVPFVRFLHTALSRVTYPFDLEWCEGGTLGHIGMILSGHQPYRAPSLEFTPYGYPPLYYYVSALVSLVVGPGHLAPRLVSLLSILGCFVLLARWVRDETGDPVAGVAAVGFFAATYAITGYWFDVGRLDAFFLLLILAAITVARRVQTTRGAAAVGVLLAAACFTKQLGIPLGLPVLLFVAARSLRRGVIAALVCGGVILAAGAAFNVASHGWFRYYLFTLLAKHEVEWHRLWPSVRTYFVGTSFPMTLAGTAVVCGLGFGPGAWRRWACHAVFIAVACASAFMPFLKTGGYPNGLIPAYAALALASGIIVATIRRARFASAVGTVGPTLAVAAVVAIQIATLDYDPTPALPTEADLAANREVVNRLARLDKPIFITGSSFYGMTIEGRVVTDTMGFADVFKAGGPESAKLEETLTEAIRNHRFKTIVLDRAAGFLPPRFVDLIHQNYTANGSVLDGLPPDVIWPKTGALLRPDEIWVAK